MTTGSEPDGTDEAVEADGGSRPTDSGPSTDANRPTDGDLSTDGGRPTGTGVCEETGHPLFVPAVVAGGLLFGAGLAASGMTKPEVVLAFLQLSDFGLLAVMGSAAAVTGTTFWLAGQSDRRAPLTGRAYTRRLTDFDRNVLAGGAVFGVGWGLSGICPGAAFASLGTGNLPILWAIGGMFLGAYAQGYVRSASAERTTTPTTAD